MTDQQLSLPFDDPTRREIEELKIQIRYNARYIGKMFSGKGEAFKVALQEVKTELQGRYVFEYQRAADVYIVSQVQS